MQLVEIMLECRGMSSSPKASHSREVVLELIDPGLSNLVYQ